MRAADLLSPPSSFLRPSAAAPLRHRPCLGGTRKSLNLSGIRAAVDGQCDEQQQRRGAVPSSSSSPPPARAIGKCPEPPWLVLPPAPPKNPFAGTPQPLPDHQIRAVGGAGFPFSLRMVQMKKRMARSPPTTTPMTAEEAEAAAQRPVARAVSALLFMIGELQGPVLDREAAEIDRASRDRRDSFSWLFRRVFANSPNLVPLVLLLISGFIAASAERAAAAPVDPIPIKEEEEEEDISKPETIVGVSIPDDRAEAAREPCGSPVIGDFKSWVDIGIKEGSLDPTKPGSESPEDRRRRTYERVIAEGEATSLILSNYAQFLYRVAHDHDRAEQYFQWAAMADPRDAEAISRYGTFLWEERGDVSRAEELFLEAIDVEPGSFHHSSNYAWFLWKTGAEDTCFPLSSPPFPSTSDPDEHC